MLGSQRLVVGNRAVGHIQRAEILDPAAERAAEAVEDGRGGDDHVRVADRLVAVDDNLVESQVAEIQDAAAAAGVARGAAVRQAGGDGQTLDGHVRTALNVEDPAGVIAADGQLLRAGTHDFQVVGDRQLAAGQRDLVDGFREEKWCPNRWRRWRRGRPVATSRGRYQGCSGP